MFQEVSSVDRATAVPFNEPSLVNTHTHTTSYANTYIECVCACLNRSPLCLWFLTRSRLTKVSGEMKQQGHGSEVGKENDETCMSVRGKKEDVREGVRRQLQHGMAE